MTKEAKFFIREIYLVFLFNLAVIFIVAKRYIDFLENTNGFFTKLFLIGNTFSHFFLIGLVPFLVTLIVFLVSKSEVAAKITNVTLATSVVLFLKVDTIVFSQFRYHLSPIVFKMFFGKRSGDIFQFSTENIVMTVLYILCAIGLQIALFYVSKKIAHREFYLKPKFVFPIFLVTLLFSHFTYAWSSPNQFRPVTQFRNIFPVYFPLTADKVLADLNLIDENLAAGNHSFEMEDANATIQYPLQPIQNGNVTNKKNVLFILIDSWQYPCFSKEITPNIYNFSQKCQVFNNHMSGSNMTTGGLFSVFYGIPATYFDTFTGQEIAPVMMTEFQKQNYAFDIYSSSTLENPPFHKNIFSKIKNLRVASKGESPSERDLNITNEWLSKMDTKNNTPFFGFLFYDAAHGFDHPKNYHSPFQPELDEVNYLELDDDYNPEKLRNRYKNALHYTDQLIGKVLKKLEDKNLLESTLIVITSDHGQEFNDNKKGYWQHGGNFSKIQVQVPMMIFDASKAPQQYSHKTLHYDISATILSDVLKVKNPVKQYSFGRNIYEKTNRPYFICGYSQKFAIIEETKITKIQPPGVFEITDHKLNPIDGTNIDYNFVSTGLEELNRFYVKK